MRRFKTEEEMAAHVVAYLEDLRWEVYQEVTAKPGGRADIVATQGPLIWVVECKRSLSMELIAQASEWRAVAHLVSIACEPARRRRSARFVEEVLGERGIGWMLVSGGERGSRERIAPKLRRRVAPWLRQALRPEHRTYAAAGNARSDYWSPYRQTCKSLLEIVCSDPGITLKEAIARIDHHYASPSSARSSLRTWIDEGKVPGVRMEREGRRLALYPEAA